MTLPQDIPPDLGKLQSAMNAAVKAHWKAFLFEGIVLALLGLAAMIVPPLASLAVTIFLGWMFLISGVVGLFATYWARQMPGFWWSLFSAALAVLAGGLLLARPAQGILTLTIVVGAYFLAEGVVTIMYALEHRRELSGRWSWLLVSGVIVSSLSSRLRFFGNTPAAARNVLEDLGLVVFVAIVGINAGNSLLAQLTGAVALKIFIVGFIACTIPPFIVWAIGFHWFKINPAVLMGGVAGARSHSGPCREAAKEINSTVPWIGFPVGYAVSGILLTIFGYFAMVLAQ
jgi:uncharacterized membrane protein HdeD (DUF308 family)